MVAAVGGTAAAGEGEAAAEGAKKGASSWNEEHESEIFKLRTKQDIAKEKIYIYMQNSTNMIDPTFSIAILMSAGKVNSFHADTCFITVTNSLENKYN